MNGNYGNIRPADVSLDDIEIFYHFTPSRNEIGDTELTKLVTNEVMSEMTTPNNTLGVEIFGGMYTLKLPVNIFNKKGIYTIMIKPIEIRTKIVDTGVLSSRPDIKGIIFDSANLGLADQFSDRFQNGGLVGYRIEYLSNDPHTFGSKIRNFFRIITSNNRVDVSQQNITNTNQKAVRYNFNDNSTLVYATVTPSSVSSTKPNARPFIGDAGQDVILTNTFFNPVMVEIEMVEHDIETLSYGLYGPQTKSLEDGIYTIYNYDKEIYKQYNLFEIKEEFSGKPLFEIRDPKINIDNSKNFNNVSNT